MKVTSKSNNNLERAMDFLKKCTRSEGMQKMDRVGEIAVQRLSSASPVRTGEFASGWKYQCSKDNGTPVCDIYNDSHPEVSNLAKMLEYGYANKNSYIAGKHFIEKTMNSMEKEISTEMEGVILDVEQTY